MKTIKNLKVELAGQVGENAVWDGPLSKEGFPMGYGSSSGCKGMEVINTLAIVNLEFQLLEELKLINK